MARNTLQHPLRFSLADPQAPEETFWNKDTARVLVPPAFGMGWSINLYPLINPPDAK